MLLLPTVVTCHVLKSSGLREARALACVGVGRNEEITTPKTSFRGHREFQVD